MIRKGTGSPAIQPATSMRLRPMRSEIWPANKFANALVRPKEIRNDSVTDFDTNPKLALAIRGRTARSKPTVAPTKALMRISRQNGRALTLMPSFMGILKPYHEGDIAGENDVLCSQCLYEIDAFVLVLITPRRLL